MPSMQEHADAFKVLTERAQPHIEVVNQKRGELLKQAAQLEDQLTALDGEDDDAEIDRLTDEINQLLEECETVPEYEELAALTLDAYKILLAVGLEVRSVFVASTKSLAALPLQLDNVTGFLRYVSPASLEYWDQLQQIMLVFNQEEGDTQLTDFAFIPEEFEVFSPDIRNIDRPVSKELYLMMLMITHIQICLSSGLGAFDVITKMSVSTDIWPSGDLVSDTNIDELTELEGDEQQFRKLKRRFNSFVAQAEGSLESKGLGLIGFLLAILFAVNEEVLATKE